MSLGTTSPPKRRATEDNQKTRILGAFPACESQKQRKRATKTPKEQNYLIIITTEKRGDQGDVHERPLHTSIPSGRAFHRRETPDSTEPERRHFVKIASEKIIYNRQHMERPQREATWRGIFSTEKKTIFLCSTPGNCYRSEVHECKNFSRENSSLLVFRKCVSPGVTNLPSSCAKLDLFPAKIAT